MKTRCIITLVFAMSLGPLFGQASQQKVLLQQIAALKVYGDYLHKGYGVIKKGLTVVSDIKSGEVGLHSDYFGSLGLVNTEVANSVEVLKIVRLQEKIIRTSNIFENSDAVSFLSEEESSYCRRVRERLMQNCWQLLEELYTILTDDELQMEDAERLEFISKIQVSMQHNYAFMKQFNTEVKVLGINRKRGHQETDKMKLLHNVK